MPIIESALGVEMSFEIARSSENIVAMAIGLEDLTADLGVSRTVEGIESFYARTRISCCCKGSRNSAYRFCIFRCWRYGGSEQNVLSSKALGFEGMGCIHPRQIPVIRQGFAPGCSGN